MGNMNTELQTIIDYLLQLQQSICTSLEELDGEAVFVDDKWERTEGGGGLSKVIQNGAIFEKGGFSICQSRNSYFNPGKINRLFVCL